jgi:membrane fusion protein, copper/silver efflux system
MMRKKIAISVVLIAVALLAFFLLVRPAALPAHEAEHANALPSFNKSAKIWVCPMHPEISQDHPGTCPICGMKLVESGATEMHEHGVHVDSATQQRLGVRLAQVKQGVIGQQIQTYGNIVVAENATFSVQTKYEGWIKKLYVHAVGENVKAGQVLYEIYSPELVARQRTYLSSIERRKQLLQTIPTSPSTESDYVMELAMDADQDRIKLHQEEGVSVESIKTIEERKQSSDIVQIVAERSGVVSQINVKEGSFISPVNSILVLADISKVWVEVALYPDQVAQVKAGDAVMIKGTAGQEIHARLGLINPVASNNKVVARAELDNTHAHLHPGTFADVTIQAHPHEALLLPRAAVIYTGHGKMVMLSRGDGHFLPVPIETGAENGDMIEVVDGLQKDSEVAINGQFLLDSAASMSAMAERMRAN